MTHFRRSQRYRFQLEVDFYRPDGSTQRALTQDVSLHGLFIRTDVLLETNQFLQMDIQVPQEPKPLKLLCVVARVVTPEEATEGRPPGCGASLFGNPKEAITRWEILVERIRAWCAAEQETARPTPAAPEPAESSRATAALPNLERSAPRVTAALPNLDGIAGRVPTARTLIPPPSSAPPTINPMAAPLSTPIAPPTIDPMAAPRSTPATINPMTAPPPVDTIRRAHVRYPASHFNLTVRPSDLETLERFSLRDVSEGGTFINTSRLLPVGSEVDLRLVHPLTGLSFKLPGRVVRTVDALDVREKGMGIRFRSGSIDKEAWGAFLHEHAPKPEVREPERERPMTRPLALGLGTTARPVSLPPEAPAPRPEPNDTLLNVKSPLRRDPEDEES